MSEFVVCFFFVMKIIVIIGKIFEAFIVYVLGFVLEDVCISLRMCVCIFFSAFSVCK